MKILSLVAFLLICPVLAALAEPNSPWIDAVIAKKPYDIEIVSGDSPAPLDALKIESLLSTATIITIGVSDEDAGLIKQNDSFDIIYTVTKKGDMFAVKIKSKGDKMGFSIDVVVHESKWMLLGGPDSKAPLVHAIAIRIKKRG